MDFTADSFQPLLQAGEARAADRVDHDPALHAGPGPARDGVDQPVGDLAFGPDERVDVDAAPRFGDFLDRGIEDAAVVDDVDPVAGLERHGDGLEERVAEVGVLHRRRVQPELACGASSEAAEQAGAEEQGEHPDHPVEVRTRPPGSNFERWAAW